MFTKNLRMSLPRSSSVLVLVASLYLGGCGLNPESAETSMSEAPANPPATAKPGPTSESKALPAPTSTTPAPQAPSTTPAPTEPPKAPPAPTSTPEGKATAQAYGLPLLPQGSTITGPFHLEGNNGVVYYADAQGRITLLYTQANAVLMLDYDAQSQKATPRFAMTLRGYHTVGASGISAPSMSPPQEMYGWPMVAEIEGRLVEVLRKMQEEGKVVDEELLDALLKKIVDQGNEIRSAK